MTYKEFLESKIELATDSGFEINPNEINKSLKSHQRDAVVWALKGGRRALFESFGGLMTVPMTAVKMGRYGYGCELNPDYFRDGVGYLQGAEQEKETPTLFDLFPELL